MSEEERERVTREATVGSVGSGGDLEARGEKAEIETRERT